MANYAKIHQSGASVEYVLNLDPNDPTDATKITKRGLRAVPAGVEAGDLVTPSGIAPSPLPKDSAPPVQTPLPSAKVDAQNSDEFIAKCLTGVIDASNGATGDLPGGMKVFVQAPVEDANGQNDLLLVNIPSYSQVIDVKGMLPLQNGDGYFNLGTANFSSSRETGVHVGTNVIGIRGFTSDWKTGGHVALVFIE